MSDRNELIEEEAVSRHFDDGNTPEEAVRNAHDAITAWLEAATDHGLPIPPVSQKPALVK